MIRFITLLKGFAILKVFITLMSAVDTKEERSINNT